MTMKLFKFVIFIILIFTLISCEPIRKTTTLKPFNIEPPKETPVVKKLPYEAFVIIDDSKVYSATDYNYNAGIIHTVEFPVGNIMKQVLPIYFNQMFQKVKYDRDMSSLIRSNDILIINAIVDNINFKEKCCLPVVLDVNARTKFVIYDSDLIALALPVYGDGSGKTSKSGLFSYIDEKDLGNTAYQALLNSVKNATDGIYAAVMNPKTQISEAKQLINKDPSKSFPYKVVANLSLKVNDIAEACAAAQMYVQLEPKDSEGYLLLHKCYLAQRQYKDALKQLEHAISLAPKSAILADKIINFYIERGKFEKAIEWIKKYLELRPDDCYAFLTLSVLHFKTDKTEEAIKIAEKALEKLTFSGVGLKISKREEEYAKISSVEPNSPAEKAGIKPGYEIVEIDGKSTLELPINDIIQKIRGEEGTEVTLRIKKSDSEELQTYKLTRVKFYTEPAAVSYKGALAIYFLEMNDFSKAKKHIEEAEKISPENSYLRLAKALLDLKEGKNEKVIEETEKLKDSHYARILQAIAFAKKGRFEEAIDLYKNTKDALLITSKTREEFFLTVKPYLEKIENRVIEYERAGQYALALREYGKLIDISDDDKAQRIRNRIGRIISQNPSLVELRDEARKHYLQAEVLFTNNKFEEAIVELDKALRLQPFNPQIYFNKALVYEKIADYVKAIENMEIYLQLAPNSPNAQTIKDQIYKWRFIHEKEI